MMRTSPHHLCHMFGFLVDSRGSQDGPHGRLFAEQDPHRVGFVQLAVQLIQDLRILLDRKESMFHHQAESLKEKLR